MARRWVAWAGILWTGIGAAGSCACSGPQPGSGPHGGPSRTPPSADAGSSDDATKLPDSGGTPDASTFEFSVSVVRSPRSGIWLPAAGAHVHLEAGRLSRELSTGPDGRAAATLDGS